MTSSKREAGCLSSERVVITGIGIVSSIGLSRDLFWESCLAGRSGAVRLEHSWVTETDIAVKIGAPVRGFDPVDSGIPAKDVPNLDRTSMFAIAAAKDALLDAQLDTVPLPDARGMYRVVGVDPFRLGVVIGSGIGGIATLEATHSRWRATRTRDGLKRNALPMLIPNAPAGQTAIRFHARGECKAVATACAAGTMSIGDAYRILRAGEADVVLAGGAEGVVTDDDAYALLGFERLKTLSTRNEEPTRASRPFDRERDGFVLGEGAAVLVLERESHAKARGAAPYAAIIGYATNCDAVSMMQLDESGEGIAALVRSAVRSAGLDLRDIEHANAHGTSTLLNDRVESKALGSLFGNGTGHVSVTAIKSMTGHAIGASGPLEVSALAMGLRDGVIPPTINYEYPDPECDIDLVANAPRRARPRAAIKTSYGFGGHNACLVLTPA